MTRITLDRATQELLHNLSEPLEFCDESGWLLGRFMPEAHELAMATVAATRQHQHEAEEGLGPELGVYGYEQDLE
jgi:hypothetical protein